MSRFLQASNINTSGEVLAELSKEDYWYVRWGVARNPNTPTDLRLSLVLENQFAVSLP